MYLRKSIVYLAVMLALTLLLIAAEAPKNVTPQTTSLGTWTILNGTYIPKENGRFLQTDSLMIKLNLAPEEYLTRRGISLTEADTLEIRGYYQKGEILCCTVSEHKKDIMIRSELGTPYVITNDQKPYVSNSAQCIGTKLCSMNCPVNAITMVKGKAVIDPEKCISCGICANGNGKNFKGCPVKAIKQLTR